MQQIADWLKRLGMPEYAQRFAENGIDVAALRHLTDQDLKDIGVLLGHRRIMLAAITELTSPAAAIPEPAAAPEPKTRDTVERRQVTVMFSDLVGSTALSARMDPEDLSELISTYQKCIAETVRHFGGFVAKYMGDGVLVYFGYPQAHEDDAERAVRAGLALIEAVATMQLSVPIRPQVRVGIATGLVVVGELIGEGTAQERVAVGETLNLAARIQAVAAPDSVVVPELTHRLAGAAGRPRRGDRATPAPLGPCEGRRRPARASLGARGFRQVADDTGIPRRSRRFGDHVFAIFRLAFSRKQRVPSVH
jgi:class 3 adenylate cyclase